MGLMREERREFNLEALQNYKLNKNKKTVHVERGFWLLQLFVMNYVLTTLFHHQYPTAPQGGDFFTHTQFEQNYNCFFYWII